MTAEDALKHPFIAAGLGNRPAEEGLVETDADEPLQSHKQWKILVSTCSNYLIAVDSAKTQ